jgi:hypothetical protein
VKIHDFIAGLETMRL